MHLCAQLLDSTESDSAACYNSVLTANLLLKNRIKPKRELWDLVCTVPQKADNKCDVTVARKRITTTQAPLLYFCN